MSRRWALCFALIATLHIGVVIAATQVHASEAAPPPPPPAVIIDLPPLPPPPPPASHVVRPQPKHVVSKPPPPQHIVLPAVPRAAVARIAVPLAPQPKARTPQRVLAQANPAPDNAPSAAPATSAPQQQVAAQAAPAATAAPALPASNPNAVPTWQGLLSGRLERFKRYPASAQYRRQQGVAYLRFTMDRHGKVLAASIDKSSGFAALDDETLQLIHRAEPLPPPPPEQPGDPIELVVPVQFFLK